MRKIMMLFLAGSWALSAGAADLVTEWAYHDNDDGTDNRTLEMVPGAGASFLGNGSETVGNDEDVVLYVLTANNFAGDQDEQVLVRWWNGEAEHWLMGAWEKNVFLGRRGEEDFGLFHGLPQEGDVMLDVWRITIPPELTRPGDNFYVVQLKGWQEGTEPSIAYLLSSSGEGSSKNNLGQAWTTGDYFGHDWKVVISE